MFEFRTLGTIDLRGDDGAILREPLQRSKRLALLAYLAVPHPVRIHRRATLIALLWPDLDESRGRGVLRHELYELRQVLGSEVFHVDGGEAVGVDGSALWCDARAFEAAVEAGHLTEAMSLVGGELLPGLNVNGGEFDRWLDATRDRFAHNASMAARSLSTRAEANGDLTAATQWARRWTELRWYDETAWRRLMSLRDRSGDRAGALAAYQALATRLHEELDAAPSPETQSLANRIRGRGTGVAPGRSDSKGDTQAEARPIADDHSPVDSELPAPAVIVISPTENLTDDERLDALGKQITHRLARGISDLCYVEVVVGAEVPWANAVVSSQLDLGADGLEVRTKLEEAGERRRLLAAHEPVSLRPHPDEDALYTVVARVMASIAAHYDPRIPIVFIGGLPVRTPSWESLLELIQGAEAFGALRFDEAVRHLLKSYELDPDSMKAGSFAALALAYSGDPAGADALATEVLRSGSSTAMDYEKHRVAWFLAELHGNRSEAYRASQDMIRLTTHPVCRFVAGREALRMLRPIESLRILEGAGRGLGWWRNWTELFEVRGAAFHLLGQHHAELDAVLDGRSRYPEALEPMRAEVRTRAALGEPEAAVEIVKQAFGLPAKLLSPADVAWTAAQELEVHGHPEAGSVVRKAALDWLGRGVPLDARGQCLAVRLLIESGDLEQAGEQLSALASSGELEPLGLAGLLAAAAGNRVGADAAIDQLRAIESPYLSGRHLLLETEIQATLGRSDVAIDALRRARADGLSAVVELHAMPALQSLRDEPEFIAFLRPRG